MSVTDIFKKVFGSKADRDMKQLKPILNKILAAYDSIDKLSDDELRAKSDELKTLISRDSGRTGEGYTCRGQGKARVRIRQTCEESG